VRGTFRVNGFPSSFLIDDNGKVVFFHYGFSAGDEKKIEENGKVVFFHYGFSAGDEKKIEEEILQLLDN